MCFPLFKGGHQPGRHIKNRRNVRILQLSSDKTFGNTRKLVQWRLWRKRNGKNSLLKLWLFDVIQSPHLHISGIPERYTSLGQPEYLKQYKNVFFLRFVNLLKNEVSKIKLPRNKISMLNFLNISKKLN